MKILTGLLLCCAAGYSAPIRVTVTNLGPANGAAFTPVWVGFHNGTFDIYNLGASASVALERIAEDGNTMPISMDFAASGSGAVDGTLGAGPIFPGNSVSMLFNLDAMSSMSRYFSYASMIVPSNDAFIANGNPLAFQIFTAGGAFLGADFVVLGSMVNDAGTEINDEVPMNTALFGQMVPNTGVNENGVVHLHLGFMPKGSGGILDAADFANADFRAPGYQVARIRVELIPEPSTWLSSLAGLAVLAKVARTRRRRL